MSPTTKPVPRLTCLTAPLLKPLACVVVVVAALAGVAAAAADSGPSGLPLPRFVSLRADEVNLRAGPGTQYPVEWVYRRRLLPVEIVAEHHNWRRIRDWQGDQGWVHHSLLIGRRSVLITGEMAEVRATREPGSRRVARVEPGVTGMLLTCPDPGPYCRVRFGRTEGWLARSAFWGSYPGEIVR
ncbi:MAG: hypothetical protein EA405_06620 [Rhodospirillales bacterium]|nr:MAG: hypothetical protein EA405_06620 [Rhodospirillales bacterium]